MEICLSALKVLVRAIKGIKNEEEGNGNNNKNDTRRESKRQGDRGRENGNMSVIKNKIGGGKEMEEKRQKGEDEEEKEEEEEEEGGIKDENNNSKEGEGRTFDPMIPAASVHRMKSTSSHPSKPKQDIPLKLDDLIPIFMPDRTGVLLSSFSLTVDDAPWISSALSQRNNTVRFINRLIDPLDALLLGAKSLRGLLFSGDDIVCPNPNELKALLLHDQINEVIRDYTALSDTLQATSINILYDMRTHPIESLMHPGLAAVQGPSLIIYLEGPALTSEAICQLLVPPEILPLYIPEEKTSTRGYGFQGGNFDFPSRFNSVGAGFGMGIGTGTGLGFGDSGVGNEEGNQAKEEKLYPLTGGKRLSSSFAITDCLQIMTGREYIIIDPCGLHLISPDDDIDTNGNGNGNGNGNDKIGGKEGGDERNKIMENIFRKKEGKIPVIPPPRAQRCFLSGSHSSPVRSPGDEDVLTRFPDQFSPMLSLPFNVDNSLRRDGSLKGLLVRMVSEVL